ncbi:MAG: hypothetical protein KBB88_00240 [Candidatus Pacebacteria bacterium]|nr:hypothetical protein [Candidatus Paceibacterota bacterium]
MLRKYFKKKPHGIEVFPEDIFLDSKNIPEFDTQQFEGRIEKSISKNTIRTMGFFFIIIGVLFVGKLSILQIIRGDAYLKRSYANSYNSEPIFAERGIIYDRNGVELAWNSFLDDNSLSRRLYKTEGFGQLLGYISYPKKDANGYFWQLEYEGKSGVEKSFQETLQGENGAKLAQRDVKGVIEKEGSIITPISGENVTLSIDARVQEKMYAVIKDLADTVGYDGGAGIVLDIHTGEIISIVSYPEYDPNILSDGSNKDIIRSYAHDHRKVYLNRAISGLYTPGSIVKPFLALAALHEKIITPEKQILSTGSISLTSPYDPNIVYTYKDNKAHGWVDMRHALAVSSNVYFYTIGGGFENQKGLGIGRIGTYTHMFGLDTKTGINMQGEVSGTVPSPEWKAANFKGDQWRIGDTYNTSIGQYGFQVTPIEMVRAVAAIANGGTLVIPSISSPVDPTTFEKLTFDENDMQVVREGMRMVVTDGGGQLLKYLPFSIAVKTGTAQVGIQKKNVNAWMEGFFPFDNPKYAFVFLMEHGPGGEAVVGASRAALPFFSWLSDTLPEYVGLSVKEE